MAGNLTNQSISLTFTFSTYFLNNQQMFMIGRLNGKVTVVTMVSRGISRAAVKLFSDKGDRVDCASRSLDENDHKLFEDSLTTTVSEDLEYNLESSWRNIYG